MNKKQEIITYITDEYSLFKKLGGNRSINLKNVNAIIKNITENGYKPTILIVNEKFEIIDGQHRLEAFKKLNLPVEYQIRNGLTIKDAIALNVANKKWDLKDYIESYVSLGYEEYIKLKQLLDTYPTLSTTVICSIACSEENLCGGTMTRAITNGTFKMVDNLYDMTNKLEFLSKFKELKISIRGRGYLVDIAITNLYSKHLIDEERMLSQLEKYGSQLLNSVVDVKDAVEKLEEIYNYRKSTKVRFLSNYMENFID